MRRKYEANEKIRMKTIVQSLQRTHSLFLPKPNIESAAVGLHQSTELLESVPAPTFVRCHLIFAMHSYSQP